MHSFDLAIDYVDSVEHVIYTVHRFHIEDSRHFAYATIAALNIPITNSGQPGRRGDFRPFSERRGSNRT